MALDGKRDGSHVRTALYVEVEGHKSKNMPTNIWKIKNGGVIYESGTEMGECISLDKNS